MKFKEIEKIEEVKVYEETILEQEKEIPQMSIGQQLEILSKVKEIDFQNSLVLKSLEQYNSKYEKLKIEQTELLDKANQKIEMLQKSNDILTLNLKKLLEIFSQKVSNEISTLGDNTEKLIDNTTQELNSVLSSKLDDISSKSTEYISQVEELKIDAKKRFESFYGRKKWIDYLIITNLVLTPIIFSYLIYFTILKK